MTQEEIDKWIEAGTPEEQVDRLVAELEHLLRVLGPLEDTGRLDGHGFATFNGARKLLASIRGEEDQEQWRFTDTGQVVTKAEIQRAYDNWQP